jgi:hypothetical protein
MHGVLAPLTIDSTTPPITGSMSDPPLKANAESITAETESILATLNLDTIDMTAEEVDFDEMDGMCDGKQDCSGD